jgi:hypothetical protein
MCNLQRVKHMLLASRLVMVLHDLWFTRCWWRLKCSGIWHHFDSKLVYWCFIGGC